MARTSVRVSPAERAFEFALCLDKASGIEYNGTGEIVVEFLDRRLTMRTFSANRSTFQYSGDGSGTVIITITEPSENKVEVPFADLKMFFARWLREQKIGHLEMQPDDQILGL